MLHRLMVRCVAPLVVALSPPALAQKKPHLAIPELGSVGTSADLTATLGGLVADEAQKMGAFEVTTAEAIKSLLALERQRQLMGCSGNTSCMAEIADALGADYLLTGKVGRLPGATPLYTLELALVDARQARRLSSDVRTATSEAELAGLVPKAVAKVLAPVASKLTGQLRLTSSEAGAAVKVDDRLVGTTPLPGALSIAAGQHLLTVEKRGFVTFEKEIRVDANKTVEERAALSPSPDFIRDYEAGANRTRPLAWFSLGGAVAGGAVAGAFQYLAVKAYGAADQPGTFLYHRAFLLQGVEIDADANHRLEAIRLQTEISRNQLVMGVSAGIGAAALLAAGGLFLFGDDPGRYARFHGIEVSLAPSAGGFGGSVTWHF